MKWPDILFPPINLFSKPTMISETDINDWKDMGYANAYLNAGMGTYKQDQLKPDVVNEPPHYKQHPSGIECIQITEHMDFLLGNAIKYIWRADHKNGLEDLKKAQWYLARKILQAEAVKGS